MLSVEELFQAKPPLELQDVERIGILEKAWNALKNNCDGSILVKLGTEEMEAHNVSLLEWIYMCRLCKLAQQYDEDAICEGYEYSFAVTDSLENVTLPDASCVSLQGMEFSATVTKQGNKYNSNADTWGTQCRVKAGSLYLFYITDLRRYGVVHESYWSL